MSGKPCAACGVIFHPKTSKQTYCSAPECQRERRRRWQQFKRENDPDYRSNQASAQQAWCKRNPHYWRKYRASNPNYVEQNREQQRQRNRQIATRAIAKMDASTSSTDLPSGLYQLIPVGPDLIAKKHVWLVQLTALSVAEVAPPNCKETT